MSDNFIGQIMMFAGGFAPRGFALCNGQLLPINQNQALFALLGTSYGGDGRVTFALPNLQSRLPLHSGQGSGLSNYALAQVGGTTSVTLTTDQTPQHTHTLNATAADATATTVSNTVLPGKPTTNPNAGTTPQFYAALVSGQPALVQHKLDPGVCSTVGSGQAHTNLMPSLCISFVICMQGVFPSRN